nr:N-acetyl-1-D-myo-inositol-2-amino-2-deoxy-alpha-D-glucopyranoside deacetylase [Amycolatopsis nigrescens]
MSPERRRLLLVHAHPDDESITTGGTMAKYAADGTDVLLVTCTLGEEGEIIPPALEQLGAWAGNQLGGYRDGELATACAALGVTEHRYLGGIGRWRDSGMAGTPAARHPRAFTAGSPDEQAGQLRALIDEFQPQVVVTYDAYGGYGHPDHIRAHQITMAAAPSSPSVARVFHTVHSAAAVERGLTALRGLPELPFPVPEDGKLPSTPDELIGTAVALGEHLEAKITALRAHATQISVLPSGICFALSNGIAQPIPDTEYFVLAHGPAAGAGTDLFGGL